MSVEALSISAIVKHGPEALRKFYSAGLGAKDFPVYEEEFKWIEKRLARKKVVNQRTFRERFPDFDWGVPKEPVQDLIEELREERAFEEATKILNTLAEGLEKDNAVDLVVRAREEFGRVTRMFLPNADVELDADVKQIVSEMRQGMILAKQGITPGIQTNIPHLDFHWGGLLPSQLICVLGRTGELKSYLTTYLGWQAKRQAQRVGMFTPELGVHPVRCRYHTLASADKSIQKELGLPRSFRNRALMMRHGFNLKAYQSLVEYLNAMPGEFHLLGGKNRGGQITVGYIEDRIQELGLDLVIVDPIYLLRPVRTFTDHPFMEIGSTAMAVEALSEKYNVPIIITNQAHRQGGGQGDAPHKDKSFGSDHPVQLADYVLGVKNITDEHKMLCRCSKSRWGDSDFRFELDFWPNTGVMRPITPLAGNYFNGHEDTEDEEIAEAVRDAAKTSKSKRKEAFSK